MKSREKEELNRFRLFVEERIDRISKDDKRKFIQFQPLDKVYRSVVWVVDHYFSVLRCSDSISILIYFNLEGVNVQKVAEFV